MIILTYRRAQWNYTKLQKRSFIYNFAALTEYSSFYDKMYLDSERILHYYIGSDTVTFCLTIIRRFT